MRCCCTSGGGRSEGTGDLAGAARWYGFSLSVLPWPPFLSLSSPVGVLEFFLLSGGGGGAGSDLPGQPAKWCCVGAVGAVCFFGAICVQSSRMRLLGILFTSEIIVANPNPREPFLMWILCVQDAVCEECGDVGVRELLLRCRKCKNAARHRYASWSC